MVVVSAIFDCGQPPLSRGLLEFEGADIGAATTVMVLRWVELYPPSDHVELRAGVQCRATEFGFQQRGKLSASDLPRMVRVIIRTGFERKARERCQRVRITPQRRGAKLGPIS